MGLCKCRKVTTLFCFQCRINVCDTCIVEKHKTCVVNKYMQWLLDSEYDPTCRLCTGHFTNDEPTIRLGCLHVFHLRCLLEYASSLPPTTAPAGYTCPKCQVPIIPPAEANDAVSSECRKQLANVSWARIGAGPVVAGAGAGAAALAPANGTAALNGTTATSLIGGLDQGVSVRKPHVAIGVPSPPGTPGAGGTSGVMIDPDDDKYARRSVNERFSRVVKNQLEESSRGGYSDGGTAGLRKTAVIMLLLMLIAVTAVELLTRARPRGSALHGDVALDPLAHPSLNN